MNAIRNILILVFVIVFNACDNKRHIHFEIQENIPCILANDSSLIDKPIEMIKSGDIIFISDYKGDSLLWLYNTRTNQMKKKELAKGEGPSDFLPPVQISFIDPSTANIHNRWHFNFNISKYDSIKKTFHNIGERIRISTDIDMIYPIKDKQYVASGKFKEGRFAILNAKGEIIHYFGEYPNLINNEKKLDSFSKFMFHQSMFSYNKDKNIIACTTSHILELYNDYKCIKQIILSSYDYQNKFENNGNYIEINKNTEIGAKRIYSTNKYIYILYNPNTFENENKLNNEIWIFNWNGDKIKKITTNYNMQCFCVDESDKIIYGIVNAPNPVIATIYINL